MIVFNLLKRPRMKGNVRNEVGNNGRDKIRMRGCRLSLKKDLKWGLKHVCELVLKSFSSKEIPKKTTEKLSLQERTRKFNKNMNLYIFLFHDILIFNTKQVAHPTLYGITNLEVVWRIKIWQRKPDISKMASFIFVKYQLFLFTSLLPLSAYLFHFGDSSLKNIGCWSIMQYSNIVIRPQLQIYHSLENFLII